MDGKVQRLSRKSDFRRLQKEGRSWSNRLMVVRACSNLSPSSRVAFSVSKAVGKAVTRNRVKRRFREIIRVAPLRQGWDMLIIARPAAAESRFKDVESALMQLFGKAGLLER